MGLDINLNILFNLLFIYFYYMIYLMKYIKRIFLTISDNKIKNYIINWKNIINIKIYLSKKYIT